ARSIRWATANGLPRSTGAIQERAKEVGGTTASLTALASSPYQAHLTRFPLKHISHDFLKNRVRYGSGRYVSRSSSVRHARITGNGPARRAGAGEAAPRPRSCALLVEIVPDRAHRDGPVGDRGGDASGRSVADIAGRENSGQAGLE